MAAQSNPAVGADEHELVITRIFDAPVAVVWRAWSDPALMVQWLGPRGFTGRIEKMDPRAGGSYRFYMRDPNGGDHWAQGVYREVIEQQRLVYTWAWADAHGRATRPETLITIGFENHSGKTRLTLRQSLFETVSARNEHRGGWESSFDRLAEYLATL